MLGNVGYRNFPTAFSPAALFAAAEPGVWYDPSDVANTDWLYNLLTFSEQFDNAAWFKFTSTVTANSAAAPNGSITADTVTDGYVENSASTVGTTYTGSVWVRMSGATAGVVRIRLVRDNYAQTLTGQDVTATSSWQRITFSGTFSASTTANARIRIDVVGQPVLLWGAQLELGSTATTYQPITTVAAGTIARFPQATLYQDSLGLTPVTAPSQPVGLMLDKSQGLVLGPELVTNGDFSGGSTGWTVGSNWTISGGAATVTTTPAGTLTQSISITAGRTYAVTFTVANIVSAFRMRLGGATNFVNTTLANGTYTYIVVAEAVDTNLVVTFSSSGTGSVDNISVKLLPGNHATQSTSGSRPTYGIVPATGRRNLVTYSEQFDNAAWSKVQATISANAVVAPNGTTTADAILDTAVSDIHYCAQSITALTPSGKTYTVSAYAKANTLNFMTLGISDISSGTLYATAVFNLSTGAVSTSGAAGTGYSVVSSSISNVGSGWYRCVVTVVAGTSVSFLRVVVAPNKTGVITASAGGFQSYLGNGSSFYAWGIQIQDGSTATDYQQVVTAFEVTEANVASLSYLSFDGIDDFMITPTITPATDKVQVFAGVRKLSDAANAAFIEWSTGYNANNGSFVLFTSTDTNGVTGAFYRFGSRGSTALAADQQALASGYAAPITNVISSTGDISGDLTTMRVNSIAATNGTGDQGTGNYLAYPMYLGRRGGTTLPFNGQMYGIITRFGANLTTTAISRTESWMNSKTSAY